MKIIKCPRTISKKPDIPCIYGEEGEQLHWVLGLAYFEHKDPTDVKYTWYICMNRTSKVYRWL